MKAVKHLNSLLKIICACSALLIASCVTIPSNTYTQDQRKAFLISASLISFRARTVLRHKGYVYHFNIRWQQQHNKFNASGFDFLGRQIFQMVGDQQQALLRHNGQEINRMSSSIISQQLGIDADPMTFLYLLMGIAQDGFDITRNKKRLLLKQTSDNLDIVYISYKDADIYPMPAQVAITANDASLKIALHSWKIK